jgi:hypothetical protein
LDHTSRNDPLHAPRGQVGSLRLALTDRNLPIAQASSSKKVDLPEPFSPTKI